jgi:hypothetical protein
MKWYTSRLQLLSRLSHSSAWQRGRATSTPWFRRRKGIGTPTVVEHLFGNSANNISHPREFEHVLQIYAARDLDAYHCNLRKKQNNIEAGTYRAGQAGFMVRIHSLKDADTGCSFDMVINQLLLDFVNRADPSKLRVERTQICRKI